MSDPWNPDRYSKGAAFVYESATDLLKLLDPKPGLASFETSDLLCRRTNIGFGLWERRAVFKNSRDWK